MDNILNKVLKDYMRTHWENHYTAEFLKEYENGCDLNSIKVDMKLSALKDIHAGWFVDSFIKLKSQPEMIKSSWKTIGVFYSVFTV